MISDSRDRALCKPTCIVTPVRSHSHVKLKVVVATFLSCQTSAVTERYTRHRATPRQKQVRKTTNRNNIAPLRFENLSFLSNLAPSFYPTRHILDRPTTFLILVHSLRSASLSIYRYPRTMANPTPSRLHRMPASATRSETWFGNIWISTVSPYVL